MLAQRREHTAGRTAEPDLGVAGISDGHEPGYGRPPDEIRPCIVRQGLGASALDPCSRTDLVDGGQYLRRQSLQSDGPLASFRRRDHVDRLGAGDAPAKSAANTKACGDNFIYVHRIHHGPML
jgi:hypothetical protein